MTADQRLATLAHHADLFAPWTGHFTRDDLAALVSAEFGSPEALGEPEAHAIRLPGTIVHVVSGNTPHAAFQSLLRGLVLGARNLVKVPSAGLPAFEEAVCRLPAPLAGLVETSPTLPAAWLDAAEVLVLYGNDETIETLTSRARPHTRVIAHGQKLSIGLVMSDPATAVRLAATDICRFDQRGCLSVHDLYVHPDCPVAAPEVAALLAAAMEEDVSRFPPGLLTPSEAGAITTLRETTRFLAASRPDEVQLRESAGSTDWTVIHETDPAVKVSCLNRVAYVKPWPEDPGRLGPAAVHVGCVATHPFTPGLPLGPLQPSRLCALGDTQHPPLTWHQDGHPPLASLVDGTP